MRVNLRRCDTPSCHCPQRAAFLSAAARVTDELAGFGQSVQA